MEHLNVRNRLVDKDNIMNVNYIFRTFNLGQSGSASSTTLFHLKRHQEISFCSVYAVNVTAKARGGRKVFRPFILIN